MTKRGTVQPVHQGEPVLWPPLEITYTTEVRATAIVHHFDNRKLSWTVPDPPGSKLTTVLTQRGWVTVDGMLFRDPTGEPFFLQPVPATHLAPGDSFDLSIDSELLLYQR